MTGRAWAYLGTALGGFGSLAANVAHCYIPPTGAPAGWRPEAGAVLSAMFWPVAVFIAVEILVRTVWPAGWWWRLARFAGLLPVALVAAVVSYRHLSGLFRHYGEDPLTATLGPLAVDGLMVMAAAALLAAHPHPARTAEPEPAPEPLPELVPEPLPEPRPTLHVVGAIPSGVVR
ncbi:DUF2637 domain-containing protein [Dactylosporangium sp. NPDC051484]|uniref:DUF2637 domain-containing protein n=1 Tax=Dactylosporangium sp. NPDC051484 TaxID=3154942 RepID=UPI003450A3C4